MTTSHFFLPILGGLPNIDTIINILNIVLICLFAGVLSFALGGFVRGLFRGWKRGTYRFVFFAIIISVSFFIIKPISNALGGMDARGILGEAIKFTYNGIEHTVKVGTFFDTAKNFFYTFLKDCLHVAAPPTKILNYSISLAGSSIRLTLMLAFGILHLTIGNLFCLLLWHLIFKRFTPKENRKIKNLKILSAFEHMAVAVASLAMVVLPVSATLSTCRDFKNIKTTNIKDETIAQTVTMIQKAAEAYDNSLFAKIFFNWSQGDGTQTYDQAFISFITAGDYEGIQTDFISSLTEIANIGSAIVNSGLLSYYGAEGIEWSAALNSNAIPSLLRALCMTDLVQVALPLGVSIALSMDNIADYLDTDTVNYLLDPSIDWTEELGNIADIYDDVLSSGVLTAIVAGTSKSPKFDLSKIYALIDDGDMSGGSLHSYGAFHSITDSKSSTIINRLITGFLYTQGLKVNEENASNFSIKDFLPVKDNGDIDYEAMVATDWLDEIGTVYDALYKLNLLDPKAVKSIFDQLNVVGESSLASYEGTLRYNDIKFEAEEEKKFDYSLLLEMAIDHPSEVGAILVGDEESLFSTQVLANYLPHLLPLLETTLNDAMKDSGVKIDLEKAALSLYDEHRNVMVANYKEEFVSLLENLSSFVCTSAGRKLLLNIEEAPGLVFDGNTLKYIDPELSAGLIDLLRGMDDSIILSTTVPTIMEGYMSGENNPLKDYGLELCFDVDNIGSELAYILSIVEECPTLLGDFLTAASTSDFGVISDLVKSNEDELVYLLDALASSKLINPVIDGKMNVNFTKLLNRVFSSSGIVIPEGLLDDVELCNTMLSQGEYVIGSNGPIYDGESGALVKVLVDLAQSDVLTNLASLDALAPADAMTILQKIDIEKLFGDVDNSLIIKEVLPGILDKAFKKVLDVPSSLEQKITFKNITSWSNEAANLKTLIDVAVNGFDLSNIDLFSGSVDPDALGELLSCLAKSRIFMKYDEDLKVYEYVFPEFVANKLTSAFSNEAASYLYGYGKTASDPDRFDAFIGKVLSLDTVDKWVGPDGEISKIVEILKSVGSIGGLDKLTSLLNNLNIDSILKVERILDSVNESEIFGNLIIYNGLNKAISSINPEGFDLSKANVAYLYNADASAREDELNLIYAFLETAFDKNYGLLKNGKIDASSLNIETISVDYLLFPLLTNLKESKVFNTSSDPSQLTFFEQAIATFLVNSKAYGEGLGVNDPINSHSTYSIASIVKSVSSWGDEIVNICSLVSLLQNSPFANLSEVFAFNSVFKGGPTEVSEKVTFLKLFLKDINSDPLLFRAIAPNVEKALKGDYFPGAGSIQEIVKKANAFCMENDLGTDYLPFTDFELENLVDIAKYFSACEDFKLSDIKTLPIDEVTTALDLVKHSYVFNKTSSSASSFQLIMKEILGQEVFASFLYPTDGSNPTSPKDAYHKDQGDYSSASSKAMYIVTSLFTPLSAPETEYIASQEDQLIIGESASIKSVLKLITSDSLASILKTSGGKTTLDIDSLNHETFITLLEGLNDNPFFYDCVVNAIASVCSKPEFSVAGIDSTSIDYYYTYKFSAGAYVPSSTDYISNFNLEKYDSYEIELLSNVFTSLKLNKSLFESFNALTLNPLIVKDILTNLFYSRIFNGNVNALHSNVILTDSNGNPYTLTDLTMFGQFIDLIYSKAGLANMAVSSYYDYDFVVLYGSNASKVKIHENIKTLSLDSWLDEISALTTDGKPHSNPDELIGLISSAQHVFKGLGLSEIKMDANTLKLLTPEKIKILLKAANGLKVPGNFLSYSIESILAGNDGVGFSTFTSLSRDYSPAIVTTVEKDIILSSYSSIVSSDSVFYRIENYESLGLKDSSVTYDLSSSLSSDQIHTFFIYSSGDEFYAYCSDDLVSKVSSNELNLSKVSYDAYLVLPSGVNADNFKLKFDTAKYINTKEDIGKENGVIDTMYHFLASAYQGPGLGYFSFKGNDIQTFLASHSLYGALNFIGQSPIFTSIGFNDDFSIASSSYSFKARDVALASMTTIDASLGLLSRKVALCKDFDVDGTYASQLSKVCECFESINFNDGVSLYREAGYFDKFITNISAGQIYADIFSEYASLEKNPFAMAYVTTNSTVYSNDSYTTLVTTDFETLDYSYSVSVYDPSGPIVKSGDHAFSLFGEYILAGQLTLSKRAANKFVTYCSGFYGLTDISLLTFAAADRSSLVVNSDVSLYSLINNPASSGVNEDFKSSCLAFSNVFKIANLLNKGLTASSALEELYGTLDGLVSSNVAKSVASNAYVAMIMNLVAPNYKSSSARKSSFYKSQDINNAASYYSGGFSYSKAYADIFSV